MKKLKVWQIVLLVIFYPVGICVLIYRLWKKKKIKSEMEEAIRVRREAKEREENERRARIKAELSSREEIPFKVVGVTFKNEDGHSRQSILRKLKWGDPPFDGDDIEITIERGEFEGSPAFPIFVNGQQIGNIGKDDIPFFLDRWRDYIGVISADISGGGTDSEGRSMKYGAIVKCLFRKAEQA